MRTTSPLSANDNRYIQIALIVGVVAAVIAVAGYFLLGAALFFQAYLFAFLFWLGISLGSLALLLLHWLVGSRWGLAIRRITEAGAGSIWVMAIFFIPLVFGLAVLYPWARPAEVVASPLLQYKSFYLNVPFFLIRAVVYFVIWMLLAFIMNWLAARLAVTASEEAVLRGRLQGLGAFGLIVYALTMTFAAVDWLMSMQPFWNSTIFGLMVIIGQVLTAMAFAILMLNLFPSLSQGYRWDYKRTPVPYSDLGALLLTLVIGWTYLAYFQMLIMWAGNLPREVVWYQDRTAGGWAFVAIFIAIFQFALPFLILLSTRIRHSLRLLSWVGGLLLLSYLINVFWLVKPSFYPGKLTVSWLDIVMPFALGGFWLAGFLYALRRRPALNAEDLLRLDVTTQHEKAIPPAPDTQ